MSEKSIPLFPLRTVLFPNGPLPLRIFEPRYLDMVSSCLKREIPFGVLLASGSANTGAVRMASVGTLARICDWYQGSDGLLGITAVGTRRFHPLHTHQQADGLYVADVELLAEDEFVALPPDYAPLADMLRGILNDLGKLYEALPKLYDDAGWLACRFAEVLPIPEEQKQKCLEIADPLARLDFVRPMLRTVRWETSQ